MALPRQVRHAEHYCLACAKSAMRPRLAEAGCPECGRQMQPMWPEAVNWAVRDILVRHDWEDIKAGHDPTLLVEPPPERGWSAAPWVCLDCETEDWVSTWMMPTCDWCCEWMWDNRGER